MNELINPTLQAEIDHYLDRVDAVLMQSNVSRSERLTICDDITGQVLEKLATRSETPQVSDIQAVIAELDPPESYGEGTGTEEASSVKLNEPARLHPMTIAAACTFQAGSVLHLLALTWVRGETGGVLILISFCLTNLLAIFFGVEAIKAMRREPHRSHGYGMAFLSVSWFPSLLLILLFLFPAHMISIEARLQLHRHNAHQRMEELTERLNTVDRGTANRDTASDHSSSQSAQPLSFMARNSFVISLICYATALGLGIPLVVSLNRKYYRKYKPIVVG